MKIKFFILCCLLLLERCTAQRQVRETWTIQEITTNYVQKGPQDVFEIPDDKGLVEGKILMDNKALILLDKSNKGFFCEDTLSMVNPVKLKKRKDNELSILFPGDELACLNKEDRTDTCYVSQSFLSLLGTEEDFVKVYQLTTSIGELTNCKLFIIEENERAVLFNESEFLLFKLHKDK